MNKRVRLTFADGSRQFFTLSQEQTLQEFTLKRVTTKMVRLYVASVYSAPTTGAHKIEFWGCEAKKKPALAIGSRSMAGFPAFVTHETKTDKSLGFRLEGAPHTILVKLRLPDARKFLTGSAMGRQWILNVGQDGQGAHHWLYDPKSGGVQFGVWSGQQITDGGLLTAQGNALQVIATVWNGETYTLYVNGRKAKKLEPPPGSADKSDRRQFHIQSERFTLSLPHIGEQAFAGHIAEAKLWKQALSADQVLTEIFKTV